MFYGFGYPATKATGFSKSIPTYSKGIAPYGKFGKPFGKFGKGKPFGKIGKGKPFGKFGYPATKAGGYSKAVPVTSVATSPFPGAI